MKKSTKALGLILCAILLVVGSVMGTLAYLTSQDTVTNTFTVGDVEITLDEAKVNTAGEPVNAEDVVVDLADAPRVEGNEYHLIPGSTYTKDPVIHVTAESESCWLLVKVENNISSVVDTAAITAQLTANGWTLVAGETNVYAQAAATAAGENVKVFESFTVNTTATNTDLDDIKDEEIVVTAYAVQAENVDTAAEAWEIVKP